MKVLAWWLTFVEEEVKKKAEQTMTGVGCVRALMIDGWFTTTAAVKKIYNDFYIKDLIMV